MVPNLFQLDRPDGSCHICDGPGGYKVTVAVAMRPELLTHKNQNHVSVTLSLFFRDKLGVMCVTTDSACFYHPISCRAFRVLVSTAQYLSEPHWWDTPP